MEKKIKNKKYFGLLGKNISYSFSRDYFLKKIQNLKLDNYKYENYDLQDINELKKIILQKKGFLYGLNVTIPYKEQVFEFVDKISGKAKKIGAINTIKITKHGKLKGYNTDEFGFKESFNKLLKKQNKKALILGSGGASKAIAYTLNSLNIKFKFVSRKNNADNTFSYKELNEKIIKEYLIIINCTPLGTFPRINLCPDIPYEFITANHILYDLTYNPLETLFLQKGKKKGAIIKNGLEMLELQAEKSWEIWNK